ncbi:MAG: RiPP maturation radical SAM C-methyltransferase [Desulfatiglandales bacterium]
MVQDPFHIALVSAPWPLFNRPSIQLGSLKAYAWASLPNVRIHALHAYLPIAADLGYALYSPISKRTWLAEAPYAALLYPEKRDDIDRLWRRKVRGTPLAGKEALASVCSRLEEATERFLKSVSWERCRLVGLSICLGQLTSSLYFARRIRSLAPSAVVAAGGSACAGVMGQSILDTFPDFDFVVSGEGEGPLLHLAGSLRHNEKAGVPPFPGLLTREGPNNGSFSQVAHLDRLPLPDYREYFELLETLPQDSRFIPELPVEISRGCWWRGISPTGKERGCRFCNLNLQWKGYRAKSADRVVREIDELTRTHRVLSVPFMDNLLPAGQSRPVFEGVARLSRDFKFFGEVRATTRPEDLRVMAAAGMQEVQVGIEALSTSLLRKLRKGTTALNNLEIMKRCETPGMPELVGNLILHVPGSDENDVAETLRVLEFVQCFRPLKTVFFWLGLGSPIWNAPRDYGIRKTFNHHNYARLFPARILEGLTLMVQGYHGGVRHRHRIWRPVRDRVREWQRSYDELHRLPRSGPILSFRDGGDFIIIRERRMGTDAMTHRLQGNSREIYLYCDQTRSFREIIGGFPGHGEDRLRGFLRMMVDKRLMYQEGDSYLALAVPHGISPAASGSPGESDGSPCPPG